MILTSDILKAIVPRILKEDSDKYMPFLTVYMPIFAIDTAQRIGGFVAQVAEESIDFHDVLENNSGKLYEGSKSLGNTHPGDGMLFKGRGLIQITGRAMYLACSLALFGDDRLLTHPEILEQPEYAVKSACWFWQKVKGLNVICDKPEDWTIFSHHFGKTYTKIQWMTILINGGLNGIVTRVANYQRAKAVLKF